MVYNVYGDNTTTLAAQSVKLDESFVPSYGLAEAMLESAQNDFAVFGAMLKSDALQMKLNEAAAEDPKAKESAEKVASASKENIITKLVEAIKALWQKIMSAAHAVAVRFQALIKKDDEFLKKYEPAIKKNGAQADEVSVKLPVAGFQSFEMNAKALFPTFDANKEFEKREMSEFFKCSGDATTATIKSLGGANGLVSKFRAHIAHMATYEKIIKDASKEIEKTAKGLKGKIKTDEEAGKTYSAFSKYRTVCLANAATYQKACALYYKFLRAAIIKAAGTVSMTEACVLDYLVEEAQCEVDDIMDMEVSKDPEDVEDVSQADTELTDSSVSDDAEKLVYDKTDCYSQEESAFIFDEPLF